MATRNTKFLIRPTVIIALCWYFCFKIDSTIVPEFALFDIFLQQVALAFVFGIILGFFLTFVTLIIEVIIESIFNKIIKRYEYDKNLKLTQLNRKARRKYQKINQTDRTLNKSIDLTSNQIYRSFETFRTPSIDINFLNFYLVKTPEIHRVGGITKYTFKCMLKDIAIIGFVSWLLHSIAILLEIHLSLLFLLVSALLTFGVAHLWVGLVWPFTNWTLVNFWLTLHKAFNFFR